MTVKKKRPAPYRHDAASRTKIPTDRDRVYLPNETAGAFRVSPSPAGTSGPVLSWRRGPEIQEIGTDALPLYVHEKVNPAAFVEQLTARFGEKAPKDIFSDFNGFPPDTRYDWYKHRGNWSNRIIRGNSVDVMASLIGKEGMAGEVQMIYFDPPYGISFSKNYQGSTRRPVSSEPLPVEATSRRAFRDTYIDGLHSYMSEIFRITTHARVLLADTGSLFLQMGRENVHRVSVVLDEVFGPENRIATIAFAKSGGGGGSKLLPQTADFLLWYAKDKDRVTYNQLYEPVEDVSDSEELKRKLAAMYSYAMVETSDGRHRTLTDAERDDPRRIYGGGGAFVLSDASDVGGGLPRL